MQGSLIDTSQRGAASSTPPTSKVTPEVLLQQLNHNSNNWDNYLGTGTRRGGKNLLPALPRNPKAPSGRSFAFRTSLQQHPRGINSGLINTGSHGGEGRARPGLGSFGLGGRAEAGPALQQQLRVSQGSCTPKSQPREGRREGGAHPRPVLTRSRSHRAKSTAQDSQPSTAWIVLPPRNIRDLIFSPLLGTERTEHLAFSRAALAVAAAAVSSHHPHPKAATTFSFQYFNESLHLTLIIIKE